MFETELDLRAMFDVTGDASRVDLGAGVEILGIFDQVSDRTVEIEGRRTGIRCIRSDAALVVLGQVVTIDEVDWKAVEKEVGLKTTFIVLEQTA